MSAMSVFQNSLVFLAEQTGSDASAAIPPYTVNTGGTSEEKPDAGHRGNAPDPTRMRPITTADRAGAGIMTVLGISMVMVALWFMISG